MRVGFDMISAGSGFRPAAGGMIHYYAGLVPALCNRPEVDRLVAFVSPWNQGLALPDHPKLEVVTCRGLPARRIGRVVYEQTALPLLARRRKVDVLMSTVNVVPLLRRGPKAVVLQSIQYRFFPEELGPLRRAYLSHAVPRSLKNADVVIAV